MHRHRTLLLAAAAVTALTVTGCDDDDQEAVEDAVDTIVEEGEEAAQTAISEVEEAAEEAVSDVAETAVRNLAAEHGEAQFADSGNPLDDNGLECEATVADGADTVDVTCTGTTEAGGSAELTGTTDELPGESVTELEGTFTGTVDGAEVFSTDTLGG